MSQIIDILSPDGISIRETNFDSKAQAIEYYNNWAKRFENQGYYSSIKGKIALDQLSYNCVFGTSNANQILFDPICKMNELLKIEKLP